MTEESHPRAGRRPPTAPGPCAASPAPPLGWATPAGRSTSGRWPRRTVPTPTPPPPAPHRAPTRYPAGPRPRPGRPRDAATGTPPHSPPVGAARTVRTRSVGSRGPPAPRGRPRRRGSRHPAVPGQSRPAARSPPPAPWLAPAVTGCERTATPPPARRHLASCNRSYADTFRDNRQPPCAHVTDLLQRGGVPGVV